MNFRTGFLSALLFGTMASTAHAAVLADFTAGALTLTAQNEAQIVVTCNAGNVAVNSNSALTPGSVSCAGVLNLVVNGDALDNTIDISGMQAAQFTALTGTSLFGGVGNDQFIGSFVADIVTGGPGSDGIDLAAGDDTNIWNNGDGTDTVLGGNGNDRQIVNGSTGATGDNFSVIPGVAPVAVRFDRTNFGLFGINLSTVEILEVNGLAGDDNISAETLTAGLISLVINGGDGNDILIGSKGDDVITGGIGNDVVDGNPGNDSIDLGDGDDSNTWNNGDNTDVVLGGVGNDRQIVNGAPVGDVFTVVPGVAPVEVRFDRSNLVPFGIGLSTVETLELNGLAGDDTISAETLTAGLISLVVNGGDGNDILVGSKGDDAITGGIGNDTVDGNPGNDSIDLGDGDDTNTWNNGDNTDVVLGGVGNDRQIVNGAPVGDVFTVVPGVAPVEVRFNRSNLVPFAIDLNTVETLELNGLAGDDNISAETLPAGLISLVVNGGDGNDILVGSSGTDVINGDAGDDLLTWNPGDGNDTNEGGAGTDTVLVNGAGVSEQFRIAATGPRFLFVRVLPTAFMLDSAGVEVLQLNAAGGDDIVETQPLFGVRQELAARVEWSVITI